MFRFWIIFLFLTCGVSHAQRNTDSLWSCWSDETQTDSARLKAIHNYISDFIFYLPDTAYYLAGLEYELAEQSSNKKFMSLALNTMGIAKMLKGDIDSALIHYRQCFDIRVENDDMRGVGDILNNIGMCHRDLGNLDSAMLYYEKSELIYEAIGHKDGQAGVWGNMAIVFQDRGDLGKAIEFYTKGLAYYEQKGSEYDIALGLNNIGSIYSMTGDKQHAFENYKRSLALRISCNDQVGVAYSYMNIAAIHSDWQQYDSALVFYEKGLDIWKMMDDSIGMAECYNGIGDMRRKLGQYQAALDYHMMALNIVANSAYKLELTYSLCSVGQIYLDLGNVATAKRYALESMAVSEEIDDASELRNAYELMFQVARAERDFTNALLYYENFISLRDSISSEASRREIINQEFKYTYDKQAIADSLKFAKDQELLAIANEAELASEEDRSYVLYGGVGFLLVFGGFIFHRFRITRKQKEIIEKQKSEVDFQKAEAVQQQHLAEEKNKEILDSITYAKRIQAAILPSKRTVNSLLPDNFILYKPKDIVAGDFYWIEVSRQEASAVGSQQKEKSNSLPPPADCLLFAAADCTGHGVPGAMVSVVCNNALNRAVREFGLTDPGKILDKTREIVVDEFGKSDEQVRDGMDISLCSFIPDDTNGAAMKLAWAGANNPLWIVRKGANTIEEFNGDKQPVGKYDNARPFTTHTTTLQTGDTIYILTDGYQDQFGGDKGKKLKASRLKEMVLSSIELSLTEQAAVLDNSFEKWKNTLEQVDDVCIIGVRI